MLRDKDLKRRRGVQGERVSKKVKTDELGWPGVDIIEEPDRSQNVVKTLLASKDDLLGSTDDEEEEADGDNGFQLHVNQAFAQRFEHNKKRKERDQLEAKYGSASSSESDSQTEDEDGEFATEAVDAEIAATLTAIRSRDPKVFDKESKFYTEAENNANGTKSEVTEKPMHLHDYHRRNLLGESDRQAQAVERAPRLPYTLEQEEIKRDLVKSMHDAIEDSSESETDDEFLKPAKTASPLTERPSIPDVKMADRDPENFLSNYFASRAWVPLSNSRFAHLESDDEEEERRAEEFEHLYNTRFEDPNEINRTIMTYSRDMVNNKSVRRDEKKSRQRAREREKERKGEEKRQRTEERNRLKKLKLDEMEEKVKMIKEASGLSGKDFKIEEWADVLEAEFDDMQWDNIMRKRFGDAYYTDDKAGGDGNVIGAGLANGDKRKKPKKPKWDDDIKINDLIPGFDEEEAPDPTLLTSDEEVAAQARNNSSASTRATRAKAKASQRRDRRILEAIADQAVDSSVSEKGSAPFRYRDVSPGSFGLSTLDILAADDADLNQFIGLKRLGSFRDPERKARDKKKFGKKYRLKMWRREVFGKDDGPEREELFVSEAAADRDTGVDENEIGAGDVKAGTRKKTKKRSRPRKAST